MDAELRLRAPGGGEVAVLVEAKRLLNTRDVPVAVERLQRAAANLDVEDAILVLAARYLAPTTRERSRPPVRATSISPGTCGSPPTVRPWSFAIEAPIATHGAAPAGRAERSRARPQPEWFAH